MANFHIVVIKSKILTFDELLKMYPNMYINVDLKDAPDSYEGTVAPTKMYEDIINNQAQDRVLVTSFYKEQNVRFREISKGQVAIEQAKKKLLKGLSNLI